MHGDIDNVLHQETRLYSKEPTSIANFPGLRASSKLSLNFPLLIIFRSAKGK